MTETGHRLIRRSCLFAPAGKEEKGPNGRRGTRGYKYRAHYPEDVDREYEQRNPDEYVYER